ncbi:MAG: DUF4124 domain-containing protein [Gammaproteobacteria bacterium]
MNKIKLLQTLVLVLAMSVAFSAQAKMYKWVDEDGVTHYTQTPPPGDIESKTIKPRTGPAPKAADKKDNSIGKNQKDKDDKKKAEAESDDGISDAEYEAQVKQACESARKSYQSYQRPRVNIQNEDGSYRVAGEEERQAGLKRAQDAINKYCK